MLFDLQSPGRRRVLKFVYGVLAVLFFVGFVGFGVGSEVGGGGIADIFGSGGGGGDDNPFEDEISAAEDRLAAAPNDPAALSELVALYYQAGTQLVDVDEETGQGSLTPEGEEELQKAADSWAKYQKAAPKQVDSSTATLAVQTFATLADSSLGRALTASDGTEALDNADDAIADWGEAAKAQQIVVGSQPSASGYSNLAFYYYRSGQIPQGDQAGQQALGAAKGGEKQQIEQELKQSKQQGEQLATGIAMLRKEIEKAGAGAGATGGNPLEDLGGGGLSGGGGLGGGGLSGP